MDRREQVTKFITRDQVGVEIAPWHSGLAPKRMGYRALILDIFDTERLRQKAAADPFLGPQFGPLVETVDLIGAASSLAALTEQRGLTGQLDYVISSHNFEHLPDPITFLRGCEAVLKPGGVVSMAIPDRRACFDHFKPHDTTGDLLDAYFEKRQRPTPRQTFVHESLPCQFVENGNAAFSFNLDVPLNKLVALHDVDQAYQHWVNLRAAPDELYRDAHCFVFTPSSLELVLQDLRWLSLISLEIIEVSSNCGNEFHVHLRKPTGAPAARDTAEFYRRRLELLHATNAEAGSSHFLLDVEQKRNAGLQAQLGASQALIRRLENQLGMPAPPAWTRATVKELVGKLNRRYPRSRQLTDGPLRLASRLLNRVGQRP